MPACRFAPCRRWAAPCLVALVLAGQLAPLFSIDFPTIDSPSMPSLSSPSSGPSTPWRGAAPYVPSPSAASQQTADAETGTKDTAAGLALTAQSISGLGGLEALESLGGSLGGLGGLEGLSGLGGLNGLDALKSLEALKNLEDEDDLKDYLSALSGSSGVDTAALEAALEKLRDSAESDSSADAPDTAAATADTATGGASDEGTAATLQQILRQLEILAQQAGENKAAQEAAPQKTDSLSDPSEPRGPENLSPSRILRFRANAADILATCTTVYFSQPDPAGAFLLTGDRLVHAGGKERNETFYFLFQPTLNQEGSFIYQVEAQLMQDWPTERSELYPLASNPALTATRTGNLVALRHATADWSLDLLVDLREGE